MVAQVNGTPKSAKRQLREVETKTRLIEAEMRLKRAQHAKRMLETWSIWGDEFGGSDLWTKLRGDGSAPFFPISIPSDRRHGANWPMFRTIQELAELRQKSRVLCSVNSYAKGLLKNLTNYVIGKGGFLFKAQPREQAIEVDVDPQMEHTPDEPDPKAEDAVARTQVFLDQFAKVNKWPQRQRECFRRVLRDGEAFVRLFYQEDSGNMPGMTLVRFVEPEQLQNPPNKTYIDGWSFGIQHQMQPIEDVETRLNYFAWYQDPATFMNMSKDEAGNFTNPQVNLTLDADTDPKWGQLIPGEDMVHVRGPDEDEAIARGMPAFAYDTWEALDRASKLQRNISTGSALQASIAWIEQYETHDAQAVEGFKDAVKSFDSAPDPATGATMPVEKFYPGTITRIPQGKTYMAPPFAEGEQSHLEVAQGDLRQGSSAFCAPEYMTGDASNANYASTQEAGTPFVKAGETDQEHYKAAFTEIIWRAVRWAIKCGVLPKDTELLVDIQAEAPAVLHQNEWEIAQKNQVLLQARVKSPQTWTMEEGLDYDQEQANWDEFNLRTGGLGMMLGLPPQEGAAALRGQAGGGNGGSSGFDK